MFKRARFSVISLALACVFLAGALVGTLLHADSLVVSQDNRKVFQVQRVRPGSTLKDIRGIIPLHDSTGCYIVWNRNTVEVYRTGWLENGAFDCTSVWRVTSQEEIRNVIALGEKSTSFIVQTVNSHTLYKADWFAKN